MKVRVSECSSYEPKNITEEVYAFGPWNKHLLLQLLYLPQFNCFKYSAVVFLMSLAQMTWSMSFSCCLAVVFERIRFKSQSHSIGLFSKVLKESKNLSFNRRSWNEKLNPFPILVGWFSPPIKLSFLVLTKWHKIWWLFLKAIQNFFFQI